MAGIITRVLDIPASSFFLFGPRSVGKSFWLKSHFRDIPYFDLLDHRLFLELSADPTRLEAALGKAQPNSWVCLDEIQKIPRLLDEVHRLMTNRRIRFALSGSSARKLRRGEADMLAGRAITKNMEGFAWKELGETFDLKRALEWGTLPIVVLGEENPAQILSAYVHTYIKEEIREEGLLRKAEPFIRFLEVAGVMNGQQVNKENIARDAHVPRSTVDTYFSILEDTLLGHVLPSYRAAAKVREVAHPKFYWFDSGVARAAAGLLYDPPDTTWLGRALETYIYHELRVYNETVNSPRPLFFYRTGANAEIDFVIETAKRTHTQRPRVVCIEVKYATSWKREWERSMRSLAESEKVTVDRMIGIYRGTQDYKFDDFEVLTVTSFLEQLFAGKIW